MYLNIMHDLGRIIYISTTFNTPNISLALNSIVLFNQTDKYFFEEA